MGNRRLYIRTVPLTPETAGNPACMLCFGNGRTRKGSICNCVERRAFVVVMDIYHRISSSAAVNPEFQHGYYSRPPQEFVADVLSTVRQVLSAAQYAIFDLHHLKGCNWHACCRILSIPNRGAFFHEEYRIRAVLGAAFRRVSLYPPQAYTAPTEPE